MADFTYHPVRVGDLRAHAAVAVAALRHRLECASDAHVRIATDSMRPVMPAGSRVRVRPVRAQEDLLGAIVAVDVGETLWVHRVVRISGRSIVTRGLASSQDDPPVDARDIVGVVCGVDGGCRSEAAMRRRAAKWAAIRRVHRALRAARLWMFDGPRRGEHRAVRLP